MWSSWRDNVISFRLIISRLIDHPFSICKYCNLYSARNVERLGGNEFRPRTVPLGFKPIPECATLDSRVSDQGRICDFIYRV